MKRLLRQIFVSLFTLLGAFAASAESDFSLSLPIACELGQDCFIQQYVDVDTGPGARDYRCGSATYDGHKGTDVRLLSVKAAEAGVPVLASAAGRVKAVRDGMEDRLVAGAADLALIEGRECGNGLVIDHGRGWETQYCHLRRGSLKVRKGEAVEVGTPLGLVGYSGDAQFAHVHLSVRRDGKIVDPFLGEAVDGTCQSDGVSAAPSLWQDGLKAGRAYSDAVIIQTGFSGAPVSPRDAELGNIAQVSPGSSALIFFARLINMRQGDALRLTVNGPSGFTASGAIKPLDRNKAHYVAFAGQKRRGKRWPAGRYKGHVELIRAGKTIRQAMIPLDLPQ